MKRAVLHLASLGVLSCSTSAPAPPAVPPVTIVTSAPPPESTSARPAAPPPAPAVIAPPIATASVEPAPQCRGGALDLEAVQKNCRCEYEVFPGIRRCSREAVRDLEIRVSAPATLAAGATATLGVLLVNTGAAPADVALIADEAPQISLRDARGAEIPVAIDGSCPASVLRQAPAAYVVLAPGASVAAALPFAATRWKYVGPGWRPPRPRARPASKAELEAEALEALLPSPAMYPSSTPCRQVSDSPLPRGVYTIEVRMPLMDGAANQRIVGRATLHVQ